MKRKDIIISSLFLVLLIMLVGILVVVNNNKSTNTNIKVETGSTVEEVFQTKKLDNVEANFIAEEANTVEKNTLTKIDDTAKEEESQAQTNNDDVETALQIEEQPRISTVPKGALAVVGTNLVNSNGETVQLKGLSTHGLAWYPDYVNKNLFREFKESWNINVIRLAMYTEEYGGYCSGGDKNNLLNVIDNGVTFATDLDLYVIIDWHILSDGNPNKNKSEAINFFDYVSKKYQDNSNVIYEICNEPNGGTSWQDIKSYALDIIPVIRANSPDSVIIVGTPTWSQEVDKAAANPISEYNNIMYALHFYADTHKDGLRNTMESAIKAGLPIFVTEYGVCDASGNGAINEAEANKWMALLDKYSVSSCAWNISNKGETSAIFNASCNKKYGFNENDLSGSGKWVYNMLTGNSFYDSSYVSFDEPSYVAEPQQNNNEYDNNSQNNNTASTTISNQSGPVNISLVAASSWESEGKTFTQYNVIVTNNNSFDINSWSGDVSFASNIELSQGWCAYYIVNENVLSLSNVDFNGYIKAGESTRDIGCIIIE